MWSELGHRLVWYYIHEYVLFGRIILWSVYTGQQMMDAVGPDPIVCADHLDCSVP